jgi:hypothetical protein
MLAMISSAVAPHCMHSDAVMGLMVPHLGQVIVSCLTGMAAPHCLHSLAIGGLGLPQAGQTFIEISAGLKHMVTPCRVGVQSDLRGHWALGKR